MWFRRDLRLHDNRALAEAARKCDAVYMVFCFDRAILDKLKDKADRRVEFIHQSVAEMQQSLGRNKAELIVCVGNARDEIPQLARELKVNSVFANHDFEPNAIERDNAVTKALRKDDVEFHSFKDHVVFEKDEVLTQSGDPYKVYTPYSRAWRKRLTQDDYEDLSIDIHVDKFPAPPKKIKSDDWSLDAMGFEKTDLQWPGGAINGRKMLNAFLEKIDNYKDDRDFPATNGTSRLSVHLRFGTVSIRECVRAAIDNESKGSQTWINELIWREFYNMILHHFPHTVREAFNETYDDLEWRESDADLQVWCEGRTGYPIIDAGMRELNTTGYMHNRVRMIVASFLTKDLRIHWKRGERYFARMLLDYDLSQNVGGWQWAASTGTDAQPYFRIFNPVRQSERFDPDGEYIRQYVPELAGVKGKAIHAPWEKPSLFDQQASGDYPQPMVDHAEAREAALKMFKVAKG